MPKTGDIIPFELDQTFIDIALREYGSRERLRKLGKTMSEATDLQLDSMLPAMYESLRAHGLPHTDLNDTIDRLITKILAIK